MLGIILSYVVLIWMFWAGLKGVSWLIDSWGFGFVVVSGVCGWVEFR